MLKTRLIAVIILRDGQVVQSVKFKHTNVIHYDAFHAIETFNRWSVDEIVFLDVSREDKGRQLFTDIVQHVSKTCFVPLAVGGWIRNEDQAQQLLAKGADKLVVNSILHDDPDLVTRLSARFGKQCIVGSMDYTHTECSGARVCIDRARHVTNHDPVAWARHAESLGVGEIMLNCVERDGNRKGYDLSMIKAVSENISIPLIAFGGVFRWKHLVEGAQAGASAVAAANIFHYTEHSTKHAKRHMADHGILVRQEGLI